MLKSFHLPSMLLNFYLIKMITIKKDQWSRLIFGFLSKAAQIELSSIYSHIILLKIHTSKVMSILIWNINLNMTIWSRSNDQNSFHAYIFSKLS